MSPDSHTVLVLDEDPATLSFLANNLCADGFTTVPVSKPEHALSKAATQFPDIAIVSVNGGTGRQIVQSIRAGEGNVDRRLPVVLTGHDRHELEVVRNLNLGADDYVPKPFSYPELLARVNALLRRVALDSPNGQRILRAGSIEVDTLGRSVKIGAHHIDLSRKLYALLAKLASDPHRVFTKNELLRELWGIPATGSTRTLDTHCCRLRDLLRGEDDIRYVQNVWGVGYRLLPA